MLTRCKQFGFDRKNIDQRLAFLRLTNADHKLAQRLNQEVISPNINIIIDRFYEGLLFHSESRKWLMDGDTIQSLKKTQSKYLLSLGIGFDTEAYFEERLRVGVMHAVIGLPLSIYQGAYSNLIQYITDAFPDSIKEDTHQCLELIDFITRITMLDITLATETYHFSNINELKDEIVLAHSREEAFRNMAETDSLTGLCNRKQSFDLLTDAMSNARQSSSGLCLLMLDIDHFKKINDTYGHQAGDEVLKQVATLITHSLRSHDIAGRYGGEEFVIGLLDVTQNIAEQVAERIRNSFVSMVINVDEQAIHVTASIGAAFLGEEDDLQSLIRRSDSALYTAKDSGRNRVVFG